MKIDCGRTENYLKYRSEIYDKHTTCAGCLFFNDSNGTCYATMYYKPKKPIDLLQKWVDENIHDDGEKAGGFTDEN